jgi:hypothetical protein
MCPGILGCVPKLATIPQERAGNQRSAQGTWFYKSSGTAATAFASQ